MTTFAPQQDVARKLEEIDESTRVAWREYSELLEDLSGREYEETESDAWDELQRALTELQAERTELLAGATTEA